MSVPTQLTSSDAPAPGRTTRLFRCVVQADLVVWLICAATIFGFLGRREIAGVRERRLAGTAADIERNGHWLLPYLQGRPRFLKPPLSDWCAVASMRLLGHSEFSFRLPFALAGFGMVGLSYVLARRLIGIEAGRTAVLILITSLYFVCKALSASTDMLLSVFTGCALVSWLAWQNQPRPWSRTWWGFYLSLALACFAKGPIALALVAVPIVIELWVSGRWRLAIDMRPWWGLLLVAALALPWPILVWCRIENVVSLWAEDVNLALSDGKGGGWLGYMDHIGNWCRFCFPWTALGVCALVLPLFRRSLESWPRVRFCYWWLAGDLAFLCTWAKQPMHYLIPLFVPLAVVEAALWHHALGLLRRMDKNRFTAWLRVGLPLGFVTLGGAAALMMHITGVIAIVPALGLGLALAVPVGLAWHCLYTRPRRAFALLTGTGLTAVCVFSGWIEPRFSVEQSCAAFGREVVAHVPADEPVYFVGIEEAMPFYADRDFRPLKSAEVPQQLPALGHGYLITTRANFEAGIRPLSSRSSLQLVFEENNHKRAQENYVLIRFSPAVSVGAHEAVESRVIR